ncbi:MAG: hypothetical protein KC619_03865 [Myxococcales bacterium]|nr:hypothetical protein [Myxococcales bacterium]
MSASDRYPSREALATRPPPEMTEEAAEGFASTALDRPRFVEEADLGVPHTGERPLPSGTRPRRPEPQRRGPSLPRFEPGPARSLPLPLWAALLGMAVLGGVAGGALGAWLAMGAT